MKKKHNQDSKIAIVGISSIFPDANDFQDFWRNICSARDSIRDVPESHWLVEDYYSEGLQPDKVYAKRGAFLSGIPFDPMDFAMPPKTLSSTDTVQLLALLAAKNVVSDTRSLQQNKVDKEKVGVILGVAAGTELMVSMSGRLQKPVWERTLRNYGLDEEQVKEISERLIKNYPSWVETTFPGLLANVVAGRIANRFDFRGPNCVVDAACASSLAAIKMAIDDLLLGRSDLMISGGIDALNDVFMYMCFCQTPALSMTGDCRPFSAQADGTMLGEGAGLVALRRLEDAERDGDCIYAIINSIGASSDGKAKSVYAPFPEGQKIAIERSYQQLDYCLNDVELIEAHGTATKAGDTAEFTALQLAYSDTGSKRKQFCALGSIKSQIGHTKSAAGAAGLIKVALSLHHKVLPATIKVDQPNPNFDINNSFLYINCNTKPWVHGLDTTRKASLSAFGFGGSNYHMALEEYVPKSDNTKGARTSVSPVSLILLSADSVDHLLAQLGSFKENVNSKSLPLLARESQVKFSRHVQYRLALLCYGQTDALSLAEKFTKKIRSAPDDDFTLSSKGVYSSSQVQNPGKIAFLFPGQGSQYLNMGSDLAVEFNCVRQVWDEAVNIKFSGSDEHLHEIVFPISSFSQKELSEKVSKLTQTEWAQPAIGAMSLSQLVLLKKLNINIDYCAGHSFGELTALYASGVIDSLEDVLTISRKRGELMAAVSQDVSGAMSVVMLDKDTLSTYLREWDIKVTIANINTPKQTVLSGQVELITAVEEKLIHNNIGFKRLDVATAFHSKTVSGCVKPFEKVLSSFTFNSPKIPVYNNTTGKPYPKDKVEIQLRLANQLAKPVNFQKQIEELYQKGVRVFIEVGPGSVLTNFVNNIITSDDYLAVSIDRKGQNGLVSLWFGLGQLAVYGVDVDFKNLWQDIAETKSDFDRSKYSKATVMIGGANYNKPYPPKQSDRLRKMDEKRRVRMVVKTVENTLESEKSIESESKKVGKQQPHDLSYNKGKFIKRDNLNNMPSDTWIKTVQDMHQSLLNAQDSFQHTLLESHKDFIKATESIIQQLSVGSFGSPSINAPEISDVVLEDTYGVKSYSSVHAEQQYLATDNQNSVLQTKKKQADLSEPSKESFVEPVKTKNKVEVDLATSVDFKNILLQVVVEKTGYPAEMLDFNMDLESELGIDSIKRVEILSSLQKTFPELEKVDTNELARLNTLGEIFEYVKPSELIDTQENVQLANEFSSFDYENFQKMLLMVVSEKTGYPEEMLGLDMDLESELGIDSIKRVEILSSLQDKIPELKSADTSILGELTTLEKIIDYTRSVVESDSILLPVNEKVDVKKKLVITS